MDRLEDLERLYSPSQFSKRYDAEGVLKNHIRFIEEHTKLVQAKVPCELGVPYGPGKKEQYDIYGTDLKDEAPILIHIHGGYYQEDSINHSNNGFIANVFHQRGIKTILLGYELAPQRTVGEILEHLQIGLRECIKYALKLNSRGIYLSGHSVGAHAIATILTDFKRSISPEASNLIKAAFLLCGLYDLEPVTKMSANELLNLSGETAREELSPLFDKTEYGGTVMYVIAAENDSPAFVEQSLLFYKKLQDEGVVSHLNVVPVVDHFDVIENLYDDGYELTAIIVNAINN